MGAAFAQGRRCAGMANPFVCGRWFAAILSPQNVLVCTSSRKRIVYAAGVSKGSSTRNSVPA